MNNNNNNNNNQFSHNKESCLSNFCKGKSFIFSNNLLCSNINNFNKNIKKKLHNNNNNNNT